MAVTKIPKQYDANSFERIVRDLQQKLDEIDKKVFVGETKSLENEGIAALDNAKLYYKVDENGINIDLGVKVRGRFHRIALITEGSTYGTTGGYAPADIQYIVYVGDARLPNGRVLTGTANQIILTPSTGQVALSTPQDIATTSTPQFERMGLGAAAGASDSLTTLGKILCGGAIEIDGALDHDGTTVGFYGVTPTTRPTAYTQTYSTAGRTHSNLTSATLTDNSGGTANTTVQALTDPADTPADADTLRDDLVANLIPELRNNIADLTAQINALIVDLTNVKQIVNQIIDDQQLNGLFQ